jgi:tetratricopeptide (TPR) repeat protein
MKTQRILINVIAVTVMLTLLWNNRAAADTLGVYQPAVVRQAQWALQRGNHDHALALLAHRGAELQRWRAEAQGNGLICQAWFQKGDYVRAEQACDLAVRAAGETNGQYLYNRAVMRLLLGRIDEAVADLKRVAIMNPAAGTITADFSVAGR